MRATILSILVAFTFAGLLLAQSPKPMVVQAATPATAPARAPVAPESTQALQSALKELQEIKAANAEALRKQAATLEQLDALEKTAEQIRIYARRG
jgi:uncharacterized protein YaaN involved in tellurite resistance